MTSVAEPLSAWEELLASQVVVERCTHCDWHTGLVPLAEGRLALLLHNCEARKDFPARCVSKYGQALVAAQS